MALDGETPTYQIPFSALAPTAAMDLVSVVTSDRFIRDRRIFRVRKVVISNPGAQTTPGLVNLQVGFGASVSGSGGANVTSVKPLDGLGADPDLVTGLGAVVHTGDSTVVSDFVPLVNVPVWVPAAVGAFAALPTQFGGPPAMTKCPTIPEGLALVLRHPGSTGASALSGYVELTCTPEDRGPFEAPLIPDGLFPSVAHVWWSGGRLMDAKGNSWTMNGTVPQVASTVTAPGGAGPFSDTNYYSLGTGSDVLDFAGDFSVCAIVNPLSGSLVGGPYIFDNGNTGAPGVGYALDPTATAFTFFNYADNVSLITANAPIANAVNVVCFGNAGTTSQIKANLGALASRTYSAWTAAVAIQARIGRGSVIAGRPWPGNVLEFWASSTTPSDALFTNIMQIVRARLGITQWG